MTHTHIWLGRRWFFAFRFRPMLRPANRGQQLVVKGGFVASSAHRRPTAVVAGERRHRHPHHQPSPVAS